MGQDDVGLGDSRQQALELQDAAKRLNDQAAAALAAKLWFRRRVASPELRKVLESLPEATGEMCRLLQRRVVTGEALDQTTAARLRDLLGTDLAGIELDSAWQLLEGLQLMFLAIGDRDPVYIRTLLEVETALEARSGDWEEPWPYYGWGRIRWRQLFARDKLAALLEATPGEAGVRPSSLSSAVEHLNALFRTRIENGRKRRTRLTLRNRFFQYSLAVLVPLVAALLALTVPASDEQVSWSVSALVAAAGAVGGTVSGVFKLRRLIRITEFRLLGMGVVVQPLVGAAAALFVMLVLMSGVVELPGVDPSDPSWAGLAAYGFAAGFSEPFWLGVVRRIAAAGEEPEPEAADEGVPAPADCESPAPQRSSTGGAGAT